MTVIGLLATIAPAWGQVSNLPGSTGRVGNLPPRPSWQATARREREHLLARLGVDRWHTAGWRGRGVKVAILDTGFRGYRDHLGGALPAQVIAHSFRADGNLEAHNSQHGILCGEVIHALAPDAELLLADWDLHRPDQYLAAVRWAKVHGARIISCSVVTPCWSDGEGGGTVHQELAAILGDGRSGSDLLCFASAGNMRDRHWSGKFRGDKDGQHVWSDGSCDNGLSPWGQETVSVQLYGKPGSDYVLTVSDVPTGLEIGRAETVADLAGRSSAAVRFPPCPGHTYRVRVRLKRGLGGPFHLASMFASLDHTTVPASVCFPADAAEVVAMGAVNRQGDKMWYSAVGPNSPRPKPDLVATVPFPSLWRERSFGGTSAAAPQGAALAALLWSRHPGWSAGQVREALRTAARDLGPAGHDWETGYGLLHLP